MKNKTKDSRPRAVEGSPCEGIIVRALVFFLAVSGIGGMVYAQPPAASNVSSALSQAEIDAVLRSLGARMRLRFEYRRPVNPSPKDLSFEVVRPERFQQLGTFIRLFNEEFRKYPPDFFRDKDLYRVVFVEKYFLKTKGIDGAFVKRAKAIYFDILRSEGNSIHQRHNIHHELFHIFGVMNEYWTADALKDVNPPGFEYGVKVPPRGPNPYNYLAPAVPGFVTDYAMTSPDEDAAELFACLMLKSEREVILKWAEKDPYLARKVERMQRFMELVNPAMDPKFWNSI